MVLEIQKFLREGGTKTSLKNIYGVKMIQSSDNPELFLFKYDQIESPMGETLVQECRGIILNVNDNWSVVARPYDKFFNYGEGHAKEIDWSSATIYDKCDGSLISMYYYKDKWCIATSGNPDASGTVYNNLGTTITFKDLFWKVWKDLGYMLPFDIHKGLTFMFELMTPYNKVVVQHRTNNIVLHGIRNRLTGLELPVDRANLWYNWKVCPTFKFNSIEEVIHNASQLEPINNEGYIVVDGYFNRVKVKSPAYVALHHLRDTLSPRRMLEIIRANEGTEFLQYFPEFKDLYEEVMYKYYKLIDYISNHINNLKEKYPNPTRKEIGLELKNEFWMGMAFLIIFDGVSINSALANMSIRKLEIWIELLCGK